MPSDAVFKIANAVHRAITKVTFGHMGWSVSTMPVLELTTTGRKTGQLRRVMLTSPIRDGDSYVVVASKGGDEQHPAWFFNLRDDPSVQVSVRGGPRRPMTARVATPDERARLWPQVTKASKNYARYQDQTTREIPLVILEPSADQVAAG
jgi:deazaflavin-dependent oxidoreductase (nitroreductase family)